MLQAGLVWDWSWAWARQQERVEIKVKYQIIVQTVVIFQCLIVQAVPKNAPMFQLLPTTWGRFLGHGV